MQKYFVFRFRLFFHYSPEMPVRTHCWLVLIPASRFIQFDFLRLSGRIQMVKLQENDTFLSRLNAEFVCFSLVYMCKLVFSQFRATLVFVII